MVHCCKNSKISIQRRSQENKQCYASSGRLRERDYIWNISLHYHIIKESTKKKILNLFCKCVYQKVTTWGYDIALEKCKTKFIVYTIYMWHLSLIHI